LEDYIDLSPWFDEPELKAGISLRNMTGSNGEIRSKLTRELQLPENGMCSAIQTHSNKIEYVKKRLQGQKLDGFISGNKNMVLTIKVADCIPIFLFENKIGLSGLIHSGWRGTVGEITINAVRVIIQNGGDPAHIHAMLGPSICKNHFEVKNDIVAQFPSKYVDSNGDESYRVDLKEMVRDQLISMGVNAGNIYDCELCTYCREDLFFSYRRDKGLKGRMIAMMGWAEKD
jgi:hypothetical protein